MVKKLPRTGILYLFKKVKLLILSESFLKRKYYGPLTFSSNRMSGKILVLKLRPKIFTANQSRVFLHISCLASYLILIL